MSFEIKGDQLNGHLTDNGELSYTVARPIGIARRIRHVGSTRCPPYFKLSERALETTLDCLRAVRIKLEDVGHKFTRLRIPKLGSERARRNTRTHC